VSEQLSADHVSAGECAPFARRSLEIIAVEDRGAYRLLRVADPDGPKPAAGQFAMLAAEERWGAGEDERPYLARAFSIARWRDGEAQFLLEDVGPGTRRLSGLRAGERLLVLGPLGVGFTGPEPGRRAILVGGGVGIAPLAIFRDQLAVSPTVLLGFRDLDHAEGAALLDFPHQPIAGDGVTRFATDDGSMGHHGLVTDLLDAELGGDADTVYACGPPRMLEAVRDMCEARQVPAQLALESGMACGFGACFGCAVPARGGGYLRVCVDGPVIDAAQLERVEAHAHHSESGQQA
jgi:dihydroorotate dehydrogenase electron transfer subunit